MAKIRNQANQIDKPVKNRRYCKKQGRTSIYFLLWAVFSVLSLVIVLLFGITQQVVMHQTYKKEAARELSDKGVKIEAAIAAPPSAFGGNYSALLRYLSNHYDVQAVVLSQEGEVLFPKEPDLEGEGSEMVHPDYTREARQLLNKLSSSGQSFAVYEGEGAYVYGSRIRLYGNSEVYLYVEKPLDLMQTTSRQMGVRMGLVAVFVFILSFAVTSVVAGWISRPITEMTKRAKLLARGDFHVDFNVGNSSEEIIELADTLNFARDELSKTDRMQKELIANVSHDFKTPLTMIKAYASMIMEISGENKAKRDKHAQIIVEEADRLASLVGDVLDLSKMRAGIDALKIAFLDMSVYVEEILDRFAYLKETQGYQLIVDIDEDLYTQADETKIGQAIYNLIGNAINYTGEDKKVYVGLKKISPTLFRFSVRDTGAGIKQEELADIWERYYRSSQAHKRPVRGTGLGLSIVKTVLEKHGLHFGVTSEPGAGSTFYVDFPLVNM